MEAKTAYTEMKMKVKGVNCELSNFLNLTLTYCFITLAFL